MQLEYDETPVPANSILGITHTTNHSLIFIGDMHYLKIITVANPQPKSPTHHWLNVKTPMPNSRSVPICYGPRHRGAGEEAVSLEFVSSSQVC